MLKKLLIAVAVLVLVAAAYAVHEIGFSNIAGMLRYDQRREGTLQVGDKAPDVVLGVVLGLLHADRDRARAGSNGAGEMHLLDALRGKPLILIFGSYT